jgi:Fe-S-cluster containining protein
MRSPIRFVDVEQVETWTRYCPGMCDSCQANSCTVYEQRPDTCRQHPQQTSQRTGAGESTHALWQTRWAHCRAHCAECGDQSRARSLERIHV